MIDVMRLLDATTNTNDEFDVRQIIIDRFKGLLIDQPEKLDRITKALDHPELLAVQGKSLHMQIFTMNNVLGKLLYRFSGRTGKHIGVQRVAMVDTDDLPTWLNLLDSGVLPVFVNNDVV